MRSKYLWNKCDRDKPFLSAERGGKSDCDEA